MHERPVCLAYSLCFTLALCSVSVVQLIGERQRGDHHVALDVFRRAPSVADLRQYEQRLEDSSWLASEVRPRVQCLQFEWLHDAGEKALRGSDGWLFYRPGFDYLCKRAAPGRDTSGDGEPLRAIVDFRDQLHARDIQLLVLIVPNKESVYPEQLTRRFPPSSVFTGRHSSRLLNGMRAAGVATVDLWSVFERAKQQDSSTLYLVQDSHWSPRGMEHAARAAAEALIERAWIDRGDDGFTCQPIHTQRQGDVLRMLRSPQLETRTPPEPVLCHQVLQADGQTPYADDPHSRVLVLGDSFLRIYQRDEPGSAGFIAHLARALAQPVTSLVNDGGASTLVRQQLCGQPDLLRGKRVVIWEIVERDIRFGTEGWQCVPLPAQ